MSSDPLHEASFSDRNEIGGDCIRGGPSADSATSLPELGQGLGEAISGFKKAMHAGEQIATTHIETPVKKS
jgi:hypothetical protein